MPLDPDRLIKPVKKLRKLVKKIDSQPSPDQIHDLRTHSRRFEAMFEALELDSRGVGKSVVKDLGRLRKRAGKVRDMDVLTGFASTLHPDGEDECSIELLEHLGARRNKVARKLYSEVRRLRPGLQKTLKRTAPVLSRIAQKKKNAAAASKKDPASAAIKLESELADPPRLDRKNLHPYRLKVKELRNVLRMAARPSDTKLIDDLRKVKDAIGEWHDWEELSAIARKALEHGRRCGLQSELKRIAGNRYDQALELTNKLRDRYLANGGPRTGKNTAARHPGARMLEAAVQLSAPN